MWNEFAHTCLVSFVEHFSRLYGPEFVAYNVHGLVHISGDVKQHGNDWMSFLLFHLKITWVSLKSL